MQCPLTRRDFCATAALALLCPPALDAQAASSRPDVAAIDHDRILAAATKALAAEPTPLTSFPSPVAPRLFYSEPDSPTAFTAHRDALFALSRHTSALAAAYQLSRDDRYASHAALHLRAWFLDPATSMMPELPHAGTLPGDAKPHFEGILDALPLAELVVAIPFLASSSSFSAEDYVSLKVWFKAYLEWMTTSRMAGLARDQKDHHGTSWLLQATAFARLTGDESALAELRHRFKTVTLRAQLLAGGTFPHELSAPYPYRNSLFALDLLAGCCQLLSSPFENLWEYELQDGPGLRSAIAFHAPYIQKRSAWPYRADLIHFTDLPVRNSSLLFAARAYQRPEYAELWKTLNPDPVVPELQRVFPISQPLLWITRSPLQRHA